MKEPIIKNDLKVYYDIPFDANTYLNNELGNHAENWPVTYILYNKTNSIAYIGETTNFKNRIFEHY